MRKLEAQQAVQLVDLFKTFMPNSFLVSGGKRRGGGIRGRRGGGGVGGREEEGMRRKRRKGVEEEGEWEVGEERFLLQFIPLSFLKVIMMPFWC